MPQVSVKVQSPPFDDSHSEPCWMTATGDYQCIIGDRIITVRIEEEVESIDTLRKRLKEHVHGTK